MNPGCKKCKFLRWRPWLGAYLATCESPNNPAKLRPAERNAAGECPDFKRPGILARILGAK